jgi:hypothetical protein
MTTFSRPSTGDETGPADPFSGLSDAERFAVGSVLAALAQPRLADELLGQEKAVTAITARICPRRTRPRPRLARPSIAVPALLRGRTLAALGATACVLAGTGGAAMAGMLPGPAEGVAHRVLHDVGVTVPPGSGTTPASGGTDSQGGRDQPADASGTGGGRRASHGTGSQSGGRGAPAGNPVVPVGGQGPQPPAQGGQGQGQGQGGGSTATNGQGGTHRHVPKHPTHGGSGGHGAAHSQSTP